MSLSPLNIEPSFPRDACAAPLRSPSPRLVAGPPKKRMARLLQRSLSFKNWEDAEVAAPHQPDTPSRCINGARPGTLLLQTTTGTGSPRPSPSNAHFISPRPQADLHDAATKVQKLFKGHRTRRNLADCAIVIEELWYII